MQSKIILYKLCFLFGIVILIVALIMKFYNFTDSGYTYGSRGGYGKGTLTPNSALTISAFLLSIGIIIKLVYKKEKIEKDAQKQMEFEKEKMEKRKQVSR